MYSVLFEYLENFYTIHQVKCTQIVLCTNLLHLWGPDVVACSQGRDNRKIYGRSIFVLKK